jgi:hypothetical protein
MGAMRKLRLIPETPKSDKCDRKESQSP